MTTRRAERRFSDLQRRLQLSRESLQVLDEQIAVWSEAFDDARIRSLVGETPQLQRDFTELSRQLDVATRERLRRQQEVDALYAERDEFLRNWAPEELT
jgi:predicted  nucleic acid-binding Zn-ribbon protein